MSFSYVNCPPANMLPKSVQSLVRGYDNAATVLAEHEAERGLVLSEYAVEEAREADAALMAAALREGIDPSSVGTPNENARRASADMHTRAVEVATTLAAEAALDLAAALAEHRDEILDQARKSVDTEAGKYAASVEAMIEARRRYNLAVEVLAWGFRIDGSRDLPNYGDDPTPPLVGEFDQINEDRLVAMLRADARRNEDLERDEARRAHLAAEDARADAANRAAANVHNAKRAEMAARGQ